MRLEFPKKVVPVDLGEYMPQMAGQVVHIWVNPPVGTRLDYHTALRSSTGGAPESLQDVYAITADLLSQGPEDTHWTVAEVIDLVTQCSVTDPMFWAWLVNRIITEIETHRGNIKKN